MHKHKNKNNGKLKWLKHVKREIHCFKQWHSQRHSWQDPGPPKCLFSLPPSSQKDQDTLIEQSNVLLKQSVPVTMLIIHSHSCIVILSLAQ